MENWLGQIQIKVDEKGRFLLPQSAADLFPEKELVLSVGVFEKRPFLELLTLSEWETRLDALKKLPPQNSKTRAYKRFLLSGSSKIKLDKQNRITLPGFQRSMMKLQKEAVMVNLESKTELWSAEVWNEISDTFVNEFESLEDWVHGETDLEEEGGHALKSVA